MGWFSSWFSCLLCILFWSERRTFFWRTLNISSWFRTSPIQRVGWGGIKDMSPKNSAPVYGGMSGWVCTSGETGREDPHRCVQNFSYCILTIVLHLLNFRWRQWGSSLPGMRPLGPIHLILCILFHVIFTSFTRQSIRNATQAVHSLCLAQPKKLLTSHEVIRDRLVVR